MNIGLIFPNKDRRYKTYHLGLGYLVSWARKQHNDVRFTLLDTRVATARETKNFFAKKYDLIGMTVFSPVYYEVISLFERISKQHPETPVCLGGPYVTTIMQDIFKETPADFAVYGEGEITFSELISHLKGQEELSNIHGLMYSGKNGQVITNPPRTYIEDLDQVPIPAYDIFPMHRYPQHRIVSSRGCPYSCSFCNSSSIWGGQWRKRSSENVLAEIDYLLKNYGRKLFIFGDNSFNIDVDRVDKFCDLLIRNNTGIMWSASVRADLITVPLAKKMKAAGCYNVAIGIESANNNVLKQINKKTTIEDIEKGIRIFRNAGIEVLGQFVIGSPNDTYETVVESINWARDSECDFVNFYSVLPFKGTPQWGYVENHGRFFDDVIHHFHSIKPRVVFETPEFPYENRVKAIKIAKKAGYYSNQDKKNWLFDFAKETTRKIQDLLPERAGEQLYMMLKSVYRFRVVKKHNV